MMRKALFIGVNEYRDPEIRNLSCSVRDAISMHDIFEELGYQTSDEERQMRRGTHLLLDKEE